MSAQQHNFRNSHWTNGDPPSIAQYRESFKGLCPTEHTALLRRISRGVEFGSPEMRAIDRTCADAKCDAQHHWCTTCMIAPRCTCLGIHNKPMDMPDGSRAWFADQAFHIWRMTNTTICDGRYAFFVRKIRAIAARGKRYSSCLCEPCRDFIIERRRAILAAFGRTYVEMAAYLWSAMEKTLCATCRGKFANAKCIDLGDACPSSKLPLDFETIANYRGRKCNETKEIKADAPAPPPAHPLAPTQLGNIFATAPPPLFSTKFDAAYGTLVDPTNLMATLANCRRSIKAKQRVAELWPLIGRNTPSRPITWDDEEGDTPEVATAN